MRSFILSVLLGAGAIGIMGALPSQADAGWPGPIPAVPVAPYLYRGYCGPSYYYGAVHYVYAPSYVPAPALVPFRALYPAPGWYGGPSPWRGWNGGNSWRGWNGYRW